MVHFSITKLSKFRLFFFMFYLLRMFNCIIILGTRILVLQNLQQRIKKKTSFSIYNLNYKFKQYSTNHPRSKITSYALAIFTNSFFDSGSGFLSGWLNFKPQNQTNKIRYVFFRKKKKTKLKENYGNSLLEWELIVSFLDFRSISTLRNPTYRYRRRLG